MNWSHASAKKVYFLHAKSVKVYKRTSEQSRASAINTAETRDFGKSERLSDEVPGLFKLLVVNPVLALHDRHGLDHLADDVLVIATGMGTTSIFSPFFAGNSRFGSTATTFNKYFIAF
ncbi:MAG: hypothetical protein IJ868_01970 [Prevotella sp.]|nr:hypothetical protein [Prevotella sp.]